MGLCPVPGGPEGHQEGYVRFRQGRGEGTYDDNYSLRECLSTLLTGHQAILLWENKMT